MLLKLKLELKPFSGVQFGVAGGHISHYLLEKCACSPKASAGP